MYYFNNFTENSLKSLKKNKKDIIDQECILYRNKKKFSYHLFISYFQLQYFFKVFFSDTVII